MPVTKPARPSSAIVCTQCSLGALRVPAGNGAVWKTSIDVSGASTRPSGRISLLMAATSRPTGVSAPLPAVKIMSAWNHSMPVTP